MNSLVVLFSVLALAAAKPSGFIEPAFVGAYAAPAAIVGPSAYSHQSRIDIKSSPAVVAAAPLAPAVIAAEPAVYAAPTVYAAPAAVSHQSRIDIKSSPAYYGAYAAAAPVAVAAPAPVAIAAPAPVAIAAPAPAFIAPSVPLDTPEVIAARAAHSQAKALAGGHFIHKRSAPFYAGAPLLSTYSAPISYAAPLTTYAHAPLTTYAHAPLAYSTPLITKAYGVHPW